MTRHDLEDILEIARTTPGAPLWERSEYERILASSPAAAVSYCALVSSVGKTLAGAGVVSFSRVEIEADLELIVVRRDFQRRGIGAALMRRLINAAARAGARLVRLEVRESNVAARSLYLAQGFRQTGRRSRYYSLPVEDALLLERRL